MSNPAVRDTEKEAAAWRELTAFVDQLPEPLFAEDWAYFVDNKIDELRDGLADV